MEETFPALQPNDLFALSYVHDARLSPDGRRIAYVISRTVEETGDEFLEIAIEDLASGARREVGFHGRTTFPRWSPDGTRLAFIGEKGQSSRLYLSDANAHDIAALTPEGSNVQGAPSWSPDGLTIAYTLFTQQRSEGVRRITRRIFRSNGLGIIDNLSLSIHLVDLRSGTSRPLEVGCLAALQPSFSPCGRRILFMGSDSAVGNPWYGIGGLKLFTIDLADRRVVEVLGDGWSVSAAAWSPCGKRIVVAGDYNSALTVPAVRLWVVNRDGSDPQCRTDDLVGNVGSRAHHDMPTWRTSEGNVLIVPDAAHAYVTLALRGCTEIWRISLEGSTRCEAVVTGSRSCIIMDASTKSSQLLYAASDLHAPWELYLSDLSSGKEKRITRLNDAVLARWPVLKVEHLKFESADCGLPLEGWHLARADRRGPQPTVMFIHGGPNLATGHIFRFDLHLLAANGFAVVFSNFRGSSGYGEPFRRGIMGDWGARGFPDHMATVDAAVARGLADPERLGVWGASHGGFATAWIVGHTTRFRAAVVESATVNWATKYYLSDAPGWIVRELGGRPDEVPDVYRSRSPLTYAWRCRTPTLMLHGEDDVRCPIADAEQFYRALHDAGCKTELVRIPGMDHMGDSTGPLSARRAQNEALLDWFRRHL